ncbi:prion-inhibition and propagation-domain-containing protein [Massariosphaeria phaeospora]|uniref:Prion-inhibition and propagation-domain-containing protein n=1 Tax=Massariosphaeria phaeospora TaxID=100035 RepID=A0A7C8IHT9_9PLEO|nr:prion-inhibition and propagation-domain-containing protein [Massariosphaeria phaeospora]
MTEVAGLVIGLPSLFSSALECFQYVRLGREFAGDFETCQLKLDLAGLGLSRWGKSIGLDKVELLEELPIPKSEAVTSRDVLKRILKLFGDAETKSKTLKGLGSKVQWALYKRDEYVKIVDTINELVNDLVDLFSSESITKEQQRLCDEEAAILAEQKESLDILHKALEDKDKLLKDALLKTAATTHQNTVTFSGEGNRGLQLGQNYGNMSNSFDCRAF